MPDIWKYIPLRIGVLNRKTGTFDPAAPVTTAILHPPVASATHSGSSIKGDWYAAEIITPSVTRWYGFADGYITPKLKFAVKFATGQERDEVVAKWKKTPSKRARS